MLSVEKISVNFVDPLLHNESKDVQREANAASPQANVICTTHQAYRKSALFRYILITSYGENTSLSTYIHSLMKDRL